MSYSLPSGEYKFSWLLHMLHMLWSKYTAKRLFIPLNRAHSIHLIWQTNSDDFLTKLRICLE